MQINRTTYCLALGLLSLMGLSNCKKRECTDADIKTYLLSKIELNDVHYTGKDTATFVTGNNDTLVCFSVKRRQYFNTGTDAAACEGTNRKLEGYEIILKDSIRKDSLFHNQYVSFTDQTTSSLAVSYRGVNFLFDYRYLKISSHIKDSVTLGGQVFKNIYIKTNNGSGDSLYYNLENGIVRIALISQGKTLQLY